MKIDIIKKTNRLTDFKYYWIAFAIIICINSALSTKLKPSLSYSIPVYLLLTIFVKLVFTNIIALLIFLAAWLFKRNFILARYVNILVKLSAFLLVIEIVLFFKR